MDADTLLALARRLIAELPFCVAATQGEGGDANARIVQPHQPREDWTVDLLTNRRCRKVREVERTGRMTLLYQHDASRSYVALVGAVTIVDDVAYKRSVWSEAHQRWNPGGPHDPSSLYLRLVPDRIELWSAAHGVIPDPPGYSAAVLLREGGGWRVTQT